MQQFDAVIVGAGAAGLMCALLLGRAGQRVLVIEHNKKPGAKILISGGGRCNFTNQDALPSNYLSSNPHFAKSALGRYSPWDIIGLLAGYGLTYHEKTLGQLFCDQGSKAVLAALLDECKAHGVHLWCNTSVDSLNKQSDSFVLETSKEQVQAKAAVIATGGLSIPKMGATDFAYKVARQFKLKVVEPRPALVPLVFPDTDRDFMTALAGVSANAVVSTRYSDHKGKKRSIEFRENILFTHRGLSGPAILQISSYLEPASEFKVNMLPDVADPASWIVEERKKDPSGKLVTLLGQKLANRLVTAILEVLDIAPDITLGALSNKSISQLCERIAHWTLTPKGSEGFAKAEVTKGGVSTDYLSSRTLEATTCDGLYFIGECVDVTGWLGGYNFQWAWASGHACAQAISANDDA